MNERRVESRYLCADLIRVSWLSQELSQELPQELPRDLPQERAEKRTHPGMEQSGNWQTSDAVLEDIAARGVCLQMENAIPAGTPVHVVLGNTEFDGHVCYCTYQQIGYFIGIHFDDAARWNTHIFQPQHLTNLQELAGFGR